MKRNIELFIKDIIEYMEKAENYAKDLTLEQFYEDDKTRDAIIRCIEVIGEASKNIPNEIRAKYSDIPWRDMAGMRDKIIHGYFRVDCKELWFVVKEEIPKLKPLLVEVLENFKI